MAAQRPLLQGNPASNDDVFLLVLDESGSVLLSTALVGGAPPSIDERLLAAASGTGQALGTIEPRAGLHLRVAVRSWERADLGRSGYAVAGQPVRVARQQVQGVRLFLMVSAVVTLLAATAAGWLATGRALRPLKRMARTAEEIGRTRDLSRRLPEAQTRDEVGQLTDSFNTMLARVEDAYRRLAGALEAQKRFVADASHELRTPLTSIRNNAGLLLGDRAVSQSDRVAALEDIAGESERMSRLVHDLLTLARADAGQHLDRVPVDLAPIVEEVCRQARRRSPDRRVLLEAAETAGLCANADAMTQLLWILLDNAVKHTADGGEVRLRLATRGHWAFLSVSDNGCGIPATDLPHIFDRFYQADTARSGGGAGLGLAIARWIVQEHGGRIEVHNNPRGGATFRVEFPLDSAVIH
jgi:signal transduction histidine kinase